MQKRFTPDEGGVFPEWEEVTLGDILEINPKTEEKIADEFYYADLASINNGVFTHGAAINHNEAPGRAQRVVHIDDVLFQSVNAENLGHYHYTKDKELDKQFVASTGFFLLRMKNGCNAFLYQLLFTKAFNQEVHKYSAGSIYPAINITEFKKIKVRIPKSIEEQRKIAAALAAYDEMIAVKTAKLETWQECKKRMVKEIFGRTKRFKDDDGKAFPEWEEKTLGDVCVRVTKRNKGCKSNLPLTISAKDGIVDQKTYFNKIVASKNLENYYIIEKGEFAYNKSYSAGFKYGSIKRLDNYEDGVLSPIYICFSISDTNIVDSDYLVQYFDSMKWNDQMSVLCNEGVRNHGAINVKTEDFFAIRIPLPCMEEQQKIGSFLAEIDKEIQIQKEFIKTYAEGKRRMMRDLIEG